MLHPLYYILEIVNFFITENFKLTNENLYFLVL